MYILHSFLSLGQLISGLVLFTLALFLFGIAFIYLFSKYQDRLKNQKIKVQQLEQQYQKQLMIANINYQEMERKRIASDLHDDIGPLLSLIGFYLGNQLNQQASASKEQKDMLVKAQDILVSAVAMVRRITYNMTPYGLELMGLEGALSETFRSIVNYKELDTSIYFSRPEIRLPQDQELMIYRVIQEVVNNIVKHSGATYIHLGQYTMINQLLIEIKHDGNGLDQNDYDRLRKEPGGMGLKNICCRLQAGGGQILYAKDDNVFITLIKTKLKTEVARVA